MTPETLAALHARSIAVPRPWTAAEFERLLSGTGVFLEAGEDGFALGRVVADEAELLTLVVSPEARRRGCGRRLLSRFAEAATARGARTAYLEVAADNAAAVALYTSAGYVETGRRRAYYAASSGAAVDALCMSRDLGS